MIIDKHPEQVEENQYPPNCKFIGFWKYIDKRYDPEVLKLAKEIDRENWELYDDILPTPYEFVDLDWDEREKQIVLKWFYTNTIACKDGKYICGSSCRICGEWLDCYVYGGGKLANKRTKNKVVFYEGKTKRTSPTLVFPASFVHYIEKHNVKPPQMIIDMALLEVKKNKGTKLQ